MNVWVYFWSATPACCFFPVASDFGQSSSLLTTIRPSAAADGMRHGTRQFHWDIFVSMNAAERSHTKRGMGGCVLLHFYLCEDHFEACRHFCHFKVLVRLRLRSLRSYFSSVGHMFTSRGSSNIFPPSLNSFNNDENILTMKAILHLIHTQHSLTTCRPKVR